MSKQILIGALSAIAAGVAIGLLIAPAKGDETRQKLSDSADNLKRKIRRLRGTASEELDELQDLFEHEVSGLKDDTRQRILKLIHSSRAGYNHIKSETMAN